MPIKKEDDANKKGYMVGHNDAGEKKLHHKSIRERREKSGAGPIEIRIYEEQISDSCLTMVKVSCGEKEIGHFIAQ